MNSKVVRINSTTSALISALRVVTGASRAEIVRRAVALYAKQWPEVEGILRDEDDHQDAIDQAAMARGQA